MSYKANISLGVILSLLMLYLFDFTLSKEILALHEGAFERSFEAFAIAKALNAIISLLQGTELSFTPIGIGLTFSIGEVLDPLNDIVERFSWVMLLSTIALGVQEFLLTLTTSNLMFILISVFASFFILTLYTKKEFLMLIFFKTFIILVILKISTVLIINVEYLSYKYIYKDKYNDAIVILKDTNATLQNLKAKTINTNPKFTHTSDSTFMPDSLEHMLNRANDYYDDIKYKLNLSRNFDQIKEKINLAFSEIIKLITFFIIQNILLPLLMFYILLVSIKYITKKDFTKLLNQKSIKML